ncbi:MAG: hypothetical protein ACOYJ1_01720 [Peptococcales bacterium]|jgi:hypothetical protein
MVTIHFKSDMYIYAPNKKEINILPMTTPKPLREILKEMGLSGGEIGFIIQNGEMLNLNKDFDTLIYDQDVIELYPFIGGG